MCLFPGAGYAGVRARLTAALGGPVPSGRGLRDLRRRLGAAPLRALFELLAGPAARPRLPGADRPVPHGVLRRLPAGEGARHRPEPGLAGQDARRGRGDRLPGYSADDAVRDRHQGAARRGRRRTADGEITWARRLLHLLDSSMLVLMDRGFDGGTFLAEVAATRAQFLVRLTATRRLPVLAHLPDGSLLRLDNPARSAARSHRRAVTAA
ncbi:MAG: transposase domain-containing protein, partial [Streptosporangiaceae bacterium]